MKHSLSIIVLIVAALVASHPLTSLAQSFQSLWATGSALPQDSPLQLVQRPDGMFRFAGALQPGELKIMTTEIHQQGVTQYLKPQLVDSYLINNGLHYTLTTDSTQEGWVVSFQEDTYCLLVNPQQRTLTGQLLLPWNEVLIAGSAFEGGANNVEWNRNGMLPFLRDHDNPYVFTWTGELGIYDNVVEPGRFKLEGQMTWGPRELHPYQQDEDLLTSTQMRQGGDDTKWRVSRAGTYRITVDLLHESFQAELLDGNGEALLYPQESGITTGIASIHHQPSSIHHQPSTVYSIDGRPQPGLRRGLNLQRQPDGKVRKVLLLR